MWFDRHGAASTYRVMSRRPLKERRVHPNEELVRREADAWDRGDPEAIVAFYTPQAVYHIPGNNPLAGDYRGHEGIREYYRKTTQLLGALDELDGREHDLMANDEHAVRLLQIRARKGDQQADFRHVAVYDVRDGKIDRVWVLEDPQQAVDAFMTHVGETLAGNA
jgi:ketosteroid isomerase-like protein